jgi:hypothetical protein
LRSAGSTAACSSTGLASRLTKSANRLRSKQFVS